MKGPALNKIRGFSASGVKIFSTKNRLYRSKRTFIKINELFSSNT